MAAGNGDRAVAKIERATAWMNSNMHDCSSLSWLLENCHYSLITSSLQQNLQQPSETTNQHIKLTHSTNTSPLRGSSLENPCLNISLTAKIRLKTWKGYFQICKHKTRFIWKSGKERNPAALAWGWWGSSSEQKGLEKGAKEELVQCPSADRVTFPS